MAKTGYKRSRNVALRPAGGGLKKAFHAVAAPFRALAERGGRKFTIMLVPHSQKNVISIHASVFSIALFFLIVAGIFASFFFYRSRTRVSARTLARLEQEAAETQASLDRLKDETASLLSAASNFQRIFSEALSAAGIGLPSEEERMRTGDLSSLFDLQRVQPGSLPEIAGLQQLSAFLEDSALPMEEMARLLSSSGLLFSDIPSLWPISGGMGHVSQAFGQNRHPFSGRWYIHRGIDLSTYRSGDAVIATADGQVVTAEYDPSFGNYIVLRHKHGFYTRYAHLLSQAVRRGDYVSQGQTIGFIGNTGLSTGPHLHYEVQIGSEVVDPANYFNMRGTGAGH